MAFANDEVESPWLIWQPTLSVRSQIPLTWNIQKEFPVTNYQKEWLVRGLLGEYEEEDDPNWIYVAGSMREISNRHNLSHQCIGKWKKRFGKHHEALHEIKGTSKSSCSDNSLANLEKKY